MPDHLLSPLLDLDPELGHLVGDDQRLAAACAELRVAVHTLAAGPWDAARLAGTSPDHIGLLVLEGVLAREVLVSDTISTELLGPGDVVRPWRVRDDCSLLLHEVRWNVLSRSRIALLDRRLGAQLGRFPEINAAIVDRVNERAQRLAVTQAISQLNRVDRRLLAFFWHLAERWGRMTPDGVAIPMTLSHRMLGQLIGARRPTVSTAISELVRTGEISRRDDATWLLTGDPVGVPTSEVERIVPVRRHLLRDDRMPIAKPERLPSSQLTPEMQRRLDELRARTEAQISDLLAAYAKSASLAERADAYDDRDGQ